MWRSQKSWLCGKPDELFQTKLCTYMKTWAPALLVALNLLLRKPDRYLLLPAFKQMKFREPGMVFSASSSTSFFARLSSLLLLNGAYILCPWLKTGMRSKQFMDSFALGETFRKKVAGALVTSLPLHWTMLLFR